MIFLHVFGVCEWPLYDTYRSVSLQSFQEYSGFASLKSQVPPGPIQSLLQYGAICTFSFFSGAYAVESRPTMKKILSTHIVASKLLNACSEVMSCQCYQDDMQLALCQLQHCSTLIWFLSLFQGASFCHFSSTSLRHLKFSYPPRTTHTHAKVGIPFLVLKSKKHPSYF